MSLNSLGKILRGIIVIICSSFIIFFLVITLSQALPFIRLNEAIEAILFWIIIILAIITYYFLPPEEFVNNSVNNSNIDEQKNK